mmetsp:Transcript_28352/g.40037  ORF Transcript_28352/g.40037 Transcript_28352/m.40037 type:complete len:203 (-) Transcript_28352:116-724(-)
MTVFHIRSITSNNQVANTCEMQDCFPNPQTHQATSKTISIEPSPHIYDPISGYYFSQSSRQILASTNEPNMVQKEEIEWKEKPAIDLSRSTVPNNELLWSSETSREMDAELIQFANILLDISRKPSSPHSVNYAQHPQRPSCKSLPSKWEYHELPKVEVRIPNSCEFHKKKHQKCPRDCPNRKDLEPSHKKAKLYYSDPDAL